MFSPFIFKKDDEIKTKEKPTVKQSTKRYSEKKRKCTDVDGIKLLPYKAPR